MAMASQGKESVGHSQKFCHIRFAEDPVRPNRRYGILRHGGMLISVFPNPDESLSFFIVSSFSMNWRSSG